MTVRPARYAATIGLAAVLAWGGVAAAPRVVRADEAELQAKVESTIREYNDARSRVRSIDENIAEGEARASRLESEMPELKSRASSSIATLYKMSQSSNSLIDLLLSADDFNELITTIQYLDIIATKNNDAVRRLVDAENEMNETRDALKVERAEAERRFAALQQADSEAMQKSVEAARRVMEMNTAQEHHAEPYPGATVPEAAKAAEKPPRFCPPRKGKTDQHRHRPAQLRQTPSHRHCRNLESEESYPRPQSGHVRQEKAHRLTTNERDGEQCEGEP